MFRWSFRDRKVVGLRMAAAGKQKSTAEEQQVGGKRGCRGGDWRKGG